MSRGPLDRRPRGCGGHDPPPWFGRCGTSYAAAVDVSELISAERIEALRRRPIAVTDKGFGAIAARRPVSAAWLAEQRPPLFGGDFMMPLLVLRDSALRHNA